MQTRTVSGHDRRTGNSYADVWTATLESPYPGTILIHQIEDKIFEDLKGGWYTGQAVRELLDFQ